MLLVLIVAQMSIVWEVYRNLDSSFTDQVAQVVNGLCYASDEAAAASTAAGSTAQQLSQATGGSTSGYNASSAFAGRVEMQRASEASNATIAALDDLADSDAMRAIGSVVEQGSQALRELCDCTTLSVPRHCISEWVARQWKHALGFIGLLFAFEGMCAILAWTFVEELDFDRLEAKQKEKERRLKLGTGRKAKKAPTWQVVSQSLDTITAISEPVINKAEHEVSCRTGRARPAY